MSRRSCWHRLGIARTTDTVAIRRAYAGKLKALDLDRDADGFQALRDARDEAMYLATLPPDEDDAPALVEPPPSTDDAILWGVGDIAAELDAEAEAAYDPPETAPIATTADEDAPYHALYDLLDPDTPDRERWFPNDEEAAAIRAAFDAILADARMARIDFYAHQDAWLSTVIALSWPTSEPIVAPAVEYFGWAAHAGEIGQSQAADFAVARVAAARFHAAVQSPGHPNHGAWRELTKPANEYSTRSWFVRASSIHALLQKVRTQYPTLEGYLDPWRVSIYETDTSGGTPKRQLAVWLIAIIVLNVLIRLPFGGSEPVQPVDYTLAQAITDSTYGSLVSLADITRANPDLGGRLSTRFERERRAGQTKSALAHDIDQALNSEVSDALIDPRFPVLQAMARLQYARAVVARDVSWDHCVAVLFGEAGPTPLPEPPTRPLEAMRRLALLTPKPSGAAPPPKLGDARLDPDVSEEIRWKAGLSGKTYADALMNKGQASDRCQARIAAYEVALSLPQKKAEPLLRVLVG
ncbi:MAG: hypothetical protein V4537_13670 [Pseudomonadota bacterium]